MSLPKIHERMVGEARGDGWCGQVQGEERRRVVDPELASHRCHYHHGAAALLRHLLSPPHTATVSEPIPSHRTLYTPLIHRLILHHGRRTVTQNHDNNHWHPRDNTSTMALSATSYFSSLDSSQNHFSQWATKFQKPSTTIGFQQVEIDSKEWDLLNRTSVELSCLRVVGNC